MEPLSFKIERRMPVFLGGRFQHGGNSYFDVLNPSSGELICQCIDADEQIINEAVMSARKCFQSEQWGKQSRGRHRGSILSKMADIIEKHRQEFIDMEHLDGGKIKKEASADLDDVIDCFRFYARLAEQLDEEEDEIIDTEDKDFHTVIVKEPIGIVGAISPWNYPLLMGVQKVSASLAAGCCVILKPSELAPLSCLMLGEVAQQSGLPDGALSVCTGLGSTAGQAMTAHSDIDMYSFTGSVSTGKEIMKNAALYGPRPVSLELGGKSPMIVFDDGIDVDLAVEWIMVGIFFNSGQVCSATSRLLVQNALKDKLTAKLLDATKKIILSYEEEARDRQFAVMGPLISDAQRRKVLNYINAAQEDGGRILCGGNIPEDTEGFYIEPTIISDLSTESRAWKEEIFGPVLCIRGFDTEEEAICEANATDYGLAAGVISADDSRCDRVARALHAGIVWKNCSQPAFVTAPWGGFKRSGFGKELGKEGLREFQVMKQVRQSRIYHLSFSHGYPRDGFHWISKITSNKNGVSWEWFISK